MAQPQALYRVEDGVAVVTLSYPPLNALHPQLLKSFFEQLQRAHADPAAHAIVVIGAGNTFCPGFDINQFQNQTGGGGIDNSINNAICSLLESGPKPTVAAIQGVALGGGLEVAMGCNSRVAVSGAKLGLPELQLGILPGFGGTQRLPRLVGLQKGCEMMLTSTPIKAEAGLKLGLVDVVVPSAAELLAAARGLALDMAGGRAARMASLHRTDKLPPMGEALSLLDFARAQAAKRARGLAHPQLCLDAVQAGIEHGGQAGLKKEGESFASAAALVTHKALVHIFFAQRATKKLRGVSDAGLQPRKLSCVAVLGGGLMGSGICTALALAGYRVLLKEVGPQFLEAGMARVRANMASRVRRGAMGQAAADAALARVQGVLDYSDFARADLVIEAAIEDVSVKQRIFADLHAACRPDCILASNTSTIDINIIGAKLPAEARARLLGAHFFSPAHIMPLLELVRTQHTSAQTLLDTIELGAKIGKTPVVVGNCTGFAVNRVFFPYTMAALLLLDVFQADPYQVDRAMGPAGFGMPMGPFRLSDLVGGDIGVHVGKNFVEAFPDRVYVSRLLPDMLAAKRLGEKSGKGFYMFDPKTRAASPDPQLAPLLAASREAAKALAKGSPLPVLSPLGAQQVAEFILFPVVNEACRVVAEGVVSKAGDMDVATVLAMGFPAPKGGLLFWADHIAGGAPYVLARLEALAAAVAPLGLAGFFAPCDYLRQAAASGRLLGAGVLEGAASKL